MSNLAERSRAPSRRQDRSSRRGRTIRKRKYRPPIATGSRRPALSLPLIRPWRRLQGRALQTALETRRL